MRQCWCLWRLSQGPQVVRQPLALRKPTLRHCPLQQRLQVFYNSQSSPAIRDMTPCHAQRRGRQAQSMSGTLILCSPLAHDRWLAPRFSQLGCCVS